MAIRKDYYIRDDVIAALRGEPELDNADLEVGVTNGAVSLRGTITNIAQASLVRHAAYSVPGVWNVEWHFQIRPSLSAAPAPTRKGIDQPRAA